MNTSSGKLKNILYSDWVKLLFIVLWTFIVALSLYFNTKSMKEHSAEMAKEDAKVMFSFIQTARLWNARHGGVYVPVTEKTPPNPYLEVPHRDIIDQEGNTYTLVNPAYMTRQLAELAKEEKSIFFHITSLNPIRPENAADTWETAALRSFEKGNREVMEKVVWGGENMYRYMSVLIVRKACLKCHKKQGYKEGDVRGGISVSFSSAKVDKTLKAEMSNFIFLHLIVYILFSAVCLFAISRGKKHWEEMNNIKAFQEELIKKRTTELTTANSRLKEEVNERREAETVLRESEKKYRLVTQSAHDAIISADEWGSVVGWNSAAEKVFGYSEREALGKMITFLVPERLRKIYLERFHSLRSHKSPWQTGEMFEAKGRNKNGDVIPVEVSISRWSSQNGIFYTGIVRDISERKRMEENLRSLNRNLEERVMFEIAKRREQEQLLLQKSKLAAMGEMIGSIAHQWRQPLNGISLIIQDIHESFKYNELTEEEIERATKEAMGQVEFMTNTINDFRNFFNPSKERSTFDAVVGMKDAIAILDAQLRTAGIEVHIEAEENCLITGYLNEYRQAMLNIISNARDAIKTSRKEESLLADGGAISITFFHLEDASLCVEIFNDGSHIPDDFIGLIFNPYVTSKPEGEGSGIGLYMTKVIIESNMQGKISVENREGGVCFIITFPPPERDATEKKEEEEDGGEMLT